MVTLRRGIKLYETYLKTELPLMIFIYLKSPELLKTYGE